MNCWAVSGKVEGMPIPWLHHPISKYWFKKGENLSLQKDVYQNSYSTIYNSQDMKAT